MFRSPDWPAAGRSGRYRVENFQGVGTVGQRLAIIMRVRTASHLLSGTDESGLVLKPGVADIWATSFNP